MDSRRRSVMQPSLDPLSNARSGIPMPSTIKKASTSSNHRMSLAGPALRAPVPPVPNTNPRQSMMRSQNVNTLLQSTSKPQYGRTPMSTSVRRGSTWGGGGGQMGPPSSLTLLKDNRPLRDKAYQARMRQDVYNYLNDSGFEISMQALTSPQGKEYRAIFDTLVLTLDPSHPLKEDARFEDEFIPVLKALRYPYAHQIDTKWLVAVASSYSWPHLLGVLHWLVELCKMRTDYLVSGHPTIQDPANIPEEFDDPYDHKALAFQYQEEAYTMWLDRHDEFTKWDQIMEERYQKRNERIQAELDEQTEKLNLAKAEYNKLKASATQVADLVTRNEQLQKDCGKLKKILERYEVRRDKLIEQIAFEKAELNRGAEILNELKAELNKLTETVKAQNLTPEEVIKMNTDREMLTRNLEDLKQKIAETHKTVMSLEVKVTNRAAAVEEALDAYTNLLSSLGLFPNPPEPWQDVDLTLELNSASSNPQQLLVGLDIRKVIRPTLSSVAEAKRLERAALENESVKVSNELDQYTTECKNLDYELCELEKKASNLNDQADDLRDASQQEAQVASAEAARLERELAAARNAAISNGLGVKSRLQALQFSYQEQIEKVNRLKEDTVRAILKNSQEIANFKQEVSRHLQELREFTEAE
ncbi:putative kinetochore protein NDC80 [Psilocybe cubensis]|uniref:Kinetochore protein NDC80 n=2 Tax=Psilocybe cubensis TaxID=181762 RepID=A0ACB8H7U5_PSICU|nr:putative kinetochore protein NDC80 [Psilocybe cubensis]KAH9483757.1 putative kinetochore protein NDC80 [Psilocybe cubensis]